MNYSVYVRKTSKEEPKMELQTKDDSLTRKIIGVLFFCPAPPPSPARLSGISELQWVLGGLISPVRKGE